jgi:KDO2-lipid IV(A) lauroyltransferase
VKATKPTLWHRIEYAAALCAIGVAARVPERLGYGFAALLGRLWFRLDGRRRRYALHFLKNAFPDADERTLLRLGACATGNLFQVPLDMAKLTRLLARGGRLADVVDCSAAAQALATPQPWIGLTGHLGSWEVAAAAIAQRAGGAHGIARLSKNPLLQGWILANRQSAGLFIYPRRGGLRHLARALARGAVGLQVVDQNQRLRGVFAPFFGEVASCERAAVTLALRHGYPLAVGAAFREPNRFRFRFVLLEPFVLAETGDRGLDLYRGVCEVNRRLEGLIRSAPEQYLWIHDRYRTKPKAGWVAGVDDEGGEGDDGEGDGADR